jgi:hypothetical protein
MSWKLNFIDRLADTLRFMVQACVLVSGIALSLALTYIVLKFAWYFVRFLDRTVFSEPW